MESSKKRRLDPDSIFVYKQSTTSQCIRESIETAFLDGIGMFIRNQKPWHASQLAGKMEHVSLPNVFNSKHDEMESVFVDLPVQTKAYDDSRLRAAKQDESKCSSGDKCECMLMARDHPFVDDGRGFVGVVYGAKYTKCLLCIRVDTQTRFYEELMANRKLKHTIQPFENVCSRVGEYNPAMCLHPTGSNNIVAPFMKHQRQNYDYHPDDSIILQKPAVNFTEAHTPPDNG